MGHERQVDRLAPETPSHGPWLRGGVIGFAAMLVVFGSMAALTGGPSPFLQEGAIVVAASVLLGGVPGSLSVILVNSLGWRRRRHERNQVSVEELQLKIEWVKARSQRPDDAWQRLFGRCEKAVRAAGEAVAIAPAAPATDWLSQLHRRMEQELRNADTLTRLARTAFPDERLTFSAAARAHPLHEQLTAAAADFESSKQTIVDIVTRLVHRPDLDGVRAELTMLEDQLPVLAEPDLS